MIQSDDLDPEQVTQHVGVEPSRSEAKESRRGRKSGLLIPLRHEWILDSGLAESASINEQVEAVVNKLGDAWGRIGELTAGGATSTLVILRSFQQGKGFGQSGIVIDKESISYLHRAGADLWIDEYDLS